MVRRPFPMVLLRSLEQVMNVEPIGIALRRGEASTK
jgi:hypothetical protein